jgi:hypothetical protein
MAGTSFTHVFPLPASAKAYLTYVVPSLPAWSSMREQCCCISAASSPERRARGPRVGRASRSPCAEAATGTVTGPVSVLWVYITGATTDLAITAFLWTGLPCFTSTCSSSYCNYCIQVSISSCVYYTLYCILCLY